MSTGQYTLLEQQSRELRRTEMRRLSAALINMISDALRNQHEKLLRRRQSRELHGRAPLRSTIGTPA